MGGPQLRQALGKPARAVATALIGQDTFDPDAALGKMSGRFQDEAGRAAAVGDAAPCTISLPGRWPT
jgi:hypothetical protein